MVDAPTVEANGEDALPGLENHAVSFCMNVTMHVTMHVAMHVLSCSRKLQLCKNLCCARHSLLRKLSNPKIEAEGNDGRCSEVTRLSPGASFKTNMFSTLKETPLFEVPHIRER